MNYFGSRGIKTDPAAPFVLVGAVVLGALIGWAVASKDTTPIKMPLSFKHIGHEDIMKETVVPRLHFPKVKPAEPAFVWTDRYGRVGVGSPENIPQECR